MATIDLSVYVIDMEKTEKETSRHVDIHMSAGLRIWICRYI